MPYLSLGHVFLVGTCRDARDLLTCKAPGFLREVGVLHGAAPLVRISKHCVGQAGARFRVAEAAA